MGGEREHGQSLFTVVLALAANAGVGLLKLGAGLLTGSGALLSEAAHSVGDISTQLMLLTAVRRSAKPADRRHPFGYGKERYFWALLAACGVLVSGAVFSVYEGIRTITEGSEESSYLWVNYLVLGLALVMEGTSFLQAVRQVRRDAAEHDESVPRQLAGTDDPAPRAVFAEDLTAVIGIGLAAAGVAMHQLTGSAVWDGVASLAIGGLLTVVAFLLAQSTKTLLIGRQADSRTLRSIELWLEEQPEIDDVVDLMTMLTGTDQVLVCARVDVVDDYQAGELEEAFVRIDVDLREAFADVHEVFIQPVPRTNRELRERVLHRYGREMADQPEDITAR